MKTPSKKGTCYLDVYKYMTEENEIPDALVVHGVLKGVNDMKGWIYGHAWIEVGDVVFQPVKQADGRTYGLGFVNRKENFYEKYGIEEKTVRRYTYEQMLKKVVETGKPGPWHDLGLGKDGYMYLEVGVEV